MNLLAATDIIRYIPPEWIFFLVLLVGIAIYMLPTWIAGFTKHPDTVGIAVVNAVFGWSGIGFLLCLIWAFRKPEAKTVIMQAPVPQGPPPLSPPPHASYSLEEHLITLESLKERRLVSDEEYERRRKRLLESI